MNRPIALALFWVSALLVACAGEASTAAESPAEPLPAPRLEPTLTTTRALEEPASAGVAAEVTEAEEKVESRAPELREGAIRLRRLVVATGVSDREPTGAADSFDRDLPRLYAFLEAVNETAEPVELRVTFEHERAEPVGHVSLELPPHSRRFRTWATTQHVRRAGRWEVVVRTADGAVIARRPFEVIE